MGLFVIISDYEYHYRNTEKYSSGKMIKCSTNKPSAVKERKEMCEHCYPVALSWLRDVMMINYSNSW